MREGMQKITNLPVKVQQKIIKKYSGLEEFYFKVFYNRHEHYKAYKAHSNDVKVLDQELLDIESELENYGALDGHDITTSISADFSENIAKDYAKNILGSVGASPEQIKLFIESHLK